MKEKISRVSAPVSWQTVPACRTMPQDFDTVTPLRLGGGRYASGRSGSEGGPVKLAQGVPCLFRGHLGNPAVVRGFPEFTGFKKLPTRLVRSEFLAGL